MTARCTCSGLDDLHAWDCPVHLAQVTASKKKRIEKDGKVFRVRRGKLVEIPPKWVGQVTARQTIEKRPSKAIHKLRKIIKYGTRPSSRKIAARTTEEKEAAQQIQEKE